MGLPTKIRAGGSQRWGLPAVRFGRGWRTQRNGVVPDEGAETGGHEGKRDQVSPLCGYRHLAGRRMLLDVSALQGNS